METLIHAPSEEWNLTERQIYRMPDLQKTKTYLLTDGHLPRISPQTQVSDLTVWTQAEHSPPCSPVP